ncbi:MAG: PIN domain-containing protein [Fibromonadaceae bacterium]|jgi:predicted nucleic acid-binding protein|nr:PIN domain-containing protein [Fibromonadaceae bacterium]
MNDILVDSSVWISYFKSRNEFSFIDDLIDDYRICINDVILTELLPSIMHQKEFLLANLLKSINKYDMNINWQELQNYQLLNIKNGNNKVPITDVLIAQNCIRNDLILLTLDKHLILMKNYLPLQIYELPTK